MLLLRMRTLGKATCKSSEEEVGGFWLQRWLRERADDGKSNLACYLRCNDRLTKYFLSISLM